MSTRPPTDLDSDERLLARTADGDQQAFALLFSRRHADVYRFALHMTGVPAIADDVTQDVFMVVMRSAARYQPGRSGVAAWMFGIARNCARQRLDRDRCLDPLDDEAEAGRDEIAVQADPLADLTRAEGIERVRKAVSSLPIRYREVVVLCDLQELSYVEAADALECAVGTVRSRLHRGRQLLAGKLSATEAAATAPVRSMSPVQAAPVVDTAPPIESSGLCRPAKLRGTRSWA
jgi:RNA polymerase sigma-70 factor (ECF subfamily)